MRLADQPFVQRLAESGPVLLAGMGGGFDVYTAVPFYLALRSLGAEVHLANFAFTALEGVSGRRLTPEHVVVEGPVGAWLRYFPERELSLWLSERVGERVPVHTFEGCGVAPLRAAYDALTAELAIETLVLVDGGTDALMRGDEVGLATPEEDATSLAAVHGLARPMRRYVVCVGFGIDTFHGVSHAHFLENTAAFQREGAFLGAFSLLPGMPEADAYVALVDAVHERHRHSIVNGSVASAIDGAFGDVHRTNRTRPSELFINPLMSMAWAYDLGAVARRNLYLETLEGTERLVEVSARIEAFRKGRTLREPRALPM
ncbi:MAG: DUF1152 domain-containing protein [Myxococcota bacterium]